MSKEHSVFGVFFHRSFKTMQFMSETPAMVSTESATVVTELPKVATMLLPGCERH